MTVAFPSSLETTFRVASGELGMCTTAWLFVREVAAARGDEGVESLRDTLGRAFPVLDAVARGWLAGHRATEARLDRVLELCADASRVLVTGLEAFFLDELVAALSRDVKVGLIRTALFPADWERVLANYGGRVEGVELSTFQLWSGRRSVLVALAYGTGAHKTFVSPSTLRVLGADVRCQFRDVVAWDVLAGPMHLHPRWLAEAPVTDFSELA